MAELKDMSLGDVMRAIPGAFMKSFGRRRSEPGDGGSGYRVGPGGFSLVPLKTAADIWVDEIAALTLSTVWACVHAIAEGIASSEWTVYRRDQEGNRTSYFGRYYDLLNYMPNPEMTPFDFRMTVIINALLGHGGFAEIVPDSSGRPAALWPLAAARVMRHRDDSGRLGYRVKNSYRDDVIIDHEWMYMIRGRSMDGEATLPLIDSAREVLARAIATRDFGSTFYANGLNFGGLLIPKDGSNFPQKERDSFVAQLREEMAGARNAHGMFFVPTALDYKQLGVEPDKAQFIQTEQHLVEEIIRYFRVPPHKVQHLLRSTNNNIEHQGIEFERDGIRPWCVRMEQEADRQIMFAEKNLRSRINTDWLKEGDALSVANTESVRIHSGQSSPDEARRRRGDNPVPGGAGSKFMAQQGMTTLERVGEEPPASASPPEENPAGDKGPRPGVKSSVVHAFTLPRQGA